MKNPDSIALRFKYFHFLAILFVVFFIFSKMIAAKVSSFGIITLNVGVLIFPLSYIFSDILTEVYGYKRTRALIIFAIAVNFIIALLLKAAIAVPPAPFWQDNQPHYEMMFGSQFRLVLASSISFFIGSMINCYFIDLLKKRNNGKRIKLRFITSTAIGVFFDSTIFILIAFTNTLPKDQLINLIICEYFIKVGYEIIMSPLTAKIALVLKSAEQIELYK